MGAIYAQQKGPPMKKLIILACMIASHLTLADSQWKELLANSFKTWLQILRYAPGSQLGTTPTPETLGITNPRLLERCRLFKEVGNEHDHNNWHFLFDDDQGYIHSPTQGYMPSLRDTSGCDDDGFL